LQGQSGWNVNLTSTASMPLIPPATEATSPYLLLFATSVSSTTCCHWTWNLIAVFAKTSHQIIRSFAPPKLLSDIQFKRPISPFYNKISPIFSYTEVIQWKCCM
jgi:hypothetical protein